MNSATKSAVCGLALLFAGLGAAQAATPDAIRAAWVPQKIQFNYFGFTTIYSCNGLAESLKTLLKAAGAHDVKVSTRGCAGDPGRPDKLVNALLQFSTLQPVPSAGTGAAPATAPVTAQWHTVTLRPQRPRPLESGDCELVEQFGRVVLPLFTTRMVKDSTRCTPHQNTITFGLTFQTLAPVEPAEAP